MNSQQLRSWNTLCCNAYVTSLLACVTLAITVGCGEAAPEVKPAARPVTFQVLGQTDPQRPNRLTGSVDSWKKEMLAFRVSGRVTDVVEPGVNIEGRVFDDEGIAARSGTLLARLDTDRYELRLDEAAARVESAMANAEQVRTELEQTIPERIKAATAEVERRSSEFRRQEALLTENATARSNVEEAENEFKQANAILAQSQAEQATKTAELAALNAQVGEAEQFRLQAELNLADCALYSPFTGQVSKVHAISGSYLQQGMPVVTVQMMDPVKVEIAVSQETDRRLRYNDQLDVYLNDADEPITGFVYLKDTVADAATRTFNVTILVRNRLVEVGFPPELDGKGLARTTDLYNLESENADGNPPYYTDESTIHRDSEGRTFVWKVEGLTIADLRSDFSPAFKVKKIYVELGEKSLPILQVYRGRELIDLGELNPTKDLVTGALPDTVVDSDTVVLSRQGWLLRPGQLVHVELRGETVQRGFYVPREAILRDDTEQYVFLVEDSDSGEQKARRVAVNVDEIVGDYRRIDAVGDEQLQVGAKLILDGAHWLRDGDAVNAFEEVDVSP